MKKIFPIIASFLIGLYLIIQPLALAQISGEGLTISPPILEINLNPGDTSRQTIKLTNPSKDLVEIYPQVMNFKASGEGGEPSFYPATSGEEKFSLASWISFNQSKIALTPEQVAEFNYQIGVPKDVEPGGHYGVVFFATEPPQLEKDISQVAIASMVGSLVLVKVSGEINEKGNLEEFSANKFYFKPPIKFTERIVNLGNVHFKPQGEIQIKDWWGKVIERVAVNEAKGNVLPESIRRFEENWSPKSSWKIVGKYSADLKITYGESNLVLKDSLVFWVIPWWMIVAFGIIILLVIFLLVRWWRKRPKRPKNQERKIILR